MTQCAVTLPDKASKEMRSCKRPATRIYKGREVCKFHETHLISVGRKRMEKALAVRWGAAREKKTVSHPHVSALSALRGFHQAVQSLRKAARQMEGCGMPHGVSPEVFKNAEETVRAGVVKVATSDRKMLDEITSKLLGPVS